MSFRAILLLPLLLLGIGACAQLPQGHAGPTIAVAVGVDERGRPFSQNQYRHDVEQCREVAVRKTADPAAVANANQQNSAIAGAIFGAALGGGLAILTGMPVGPAFAIAGLGAASGGATGAAYGGVNAQWTNAVVQQRLDAEFQTCMFSRGHGNQKRAA